MAHFFHRHHHNHSCLHFKNSEFNEDDHSNEHTNHRLCTFLPATITDDDNEHINRRFCTFLPATIADRNVTTEPGGSPLKGGAVSTRSNRIRRQRIPRSACNVMR
ncbi:helicase superfamily protein [Anopheles sinensis]|uniref:Helicase superfamily protein n=1 Tax=Anopheles sinensis TaxID=74873 RepID=A0A084WNU1_ANOSI|nr:helicase superfamily protein [Anopheles sinensis]